MPAAQRLDAPIQRRGINLYVVLKAGWREALGRQVLVRVRRAGRARPAVAPLRLTQAERLIRARRLTRDGWFRTTIVRQEGEDWVYLDHFMRRSAGAGEGEDVTVFLRPDVRPRTVAVHPRLAAALAKDPVAMKAWEARAPSRRKGALQYLNFLKGPAAVDRAVEKLIRELHMAPKRRPGNP